ncbi:MAG: hypothetical protein IV101_20285 [Dechloromonas sp.]|nr:hypothetical protein [Dechloromonas sp.]
MCGSKDLRQRGAVLFFALIALVVMTLAAVALIRSVDTNTLIAGNLAFKQSATSSGDGGVEAAITWLTNNAAALDNSSAAAGYYNSVNQLPAMNLVGLTWSAANSQSAGTDAAGNTVRYIIQRMCRHTGAANSLVSPVIIPDESNCLFSDGEKGGSGKGVLAATEAGAGLTGSGSPIYRVTAQVTGPRNTVSYVQAFVF